MPPLSLLIKPASSNCNLRCRYCFYHSIAEGRKVHSYGIMNTETMETLIKNALAYADQFCSFSFQGGEPSLAGLDYFRKFVEYTRKYNAKKVHINFALQTNGLLMNDEWAQFLAENKFLTGISLDGPKEIHDEARLDSINKGSFSSVMDTIKFFNKYSVEYNILCVVTSNVARYANKVYNFFKRNHFRYLQFIPCLDPLGEKAGSHSYSLTPQRYAHFLKVLFDEWYRDFINGERISIRYFDNLLGILLGQPPESCGMSGICSAYFVIEANGGVYPCDFYVLDEWFMGNIHEADFYLLKNTDAARNFIETSLPVSPECRECRWFQLCRGGCRRNREPFEGGAPVLNYYCTSFKEFYTYAGERLIRIARQL